MSARGLLITFLIIFTLGILFIVILPFVLGLGPFAPVRREDAKRTAEFADQGVFRTDDGGATWQQKAFIEGEEASIASFQVNRLIPDPASPERLYLATDGNGLWVTESRGDLWAPVRDETGRLSPSANVLALAVNPANQAEWYVAVFHESRGRLLRTLDSGRTFEEVYFTPLERFGVFDVYYDRTARSVLIATGQGGLLESSDQGRTWRVRRWFADGLLRILADPTAPNAWFVVTPRGSIFRSLDRGESWSDVTGALRGFTGSTANQHWFIDTAGGLYVGSNHGLLRSRNHAASFEAPPLIVPPDALPVSAVAVKPSNPREIVLAVNGQFYGSNDDGATWAILPVPSEKRTKQLLFDAGDPNILYAVVNP